MRICFVATLLAVIGCGQTVAALVRHYPLNDNAASTTVVATVGTNGTLLGGDNTDAKTTAGPGGTITAGLALNGTDDTISFTSFTPTTLTISIWGKFNATPSNVVLVGRSITGAHRIIVNSATSISFTATNSASTFTVPAMSTGVWYHVCVTRDGSNNVRLYLNAIESSTGPLSNSNNPVLDRLGSGNASNFLNGALAQFKYYDTVESPATLYAEGVAKGGLYRVLLNSNYE